MEKLDNTGRICDTNHTMNTYDKISKQAHRDILTFGTGYIEMIERRWYNPLRWLVGLQKFRCIKPQDISVCRKGNA